MTTNEPATNVSDTLDDLLNNPFETNTDNLTVNQQTELNELQQQQTAPRMMDRLSTERQQQARELASKIDSNDQQL